jgi:hypothetical protein
MRSEKRTSVRIQVKCEARSVKRAQFSGYLDAEPNRTLRHHLPANTADTPGETR